MKRDKATYSKKQKSALSQLRGSLVLPSKFRYIPLEKVIEMARERRAQELVNKLNLNRNPPPDVI